MALVVVVDLVEDAALVVVEELVAAVVAVEELEAETLIVLVKEVGVSALVVVVKGFTRKSSLHKASLFLLLDGSLVFFRIRSLGLITLLSIELSLLEELCFS